MKDYSESSKPAAAAATGGGWQSDNLAYGAAGSASVAGSSAAPLSAGATAATSAAATSVAAAPTNESLYEALVRYQIEHDDDDDDDDSIVRRRNRKKAAQPKKPPGWKSDSGADSDGSFEDSKPSAKPMPNGFSSNKPAVKPAPLAAAAGGTPPDQCVPPRSSSEMSSFYRLAMEDSRMAPQSPMTPRMNSLTADDAAIAAAVASAEGFSQQTLKFQGPQSPPAVKPGVVRVNEPVVRPDTEMYRIQSEQQEYIRQQQQKKQEKRARKEKRRQQKEAAAVANSGLAVAQPVQPITARTVPARQIATAVAVPIEKGRKGAKTKIQTAIVTPAPQPIIQTKPAAMRSMDNIGLFDMGIPPPANNAGGIAQIFRRQNTQSPVPPSGNNNGSGLSVSSHDRYDRRTQDAPVRVARVSPTTDKPRIAGGLDPNGIRRAPVPTDSGMLRHARGAESAHIRQQPTVTAIPTAAHGATVAAIPPSKASVDPYGGGMLSAAQQPSFRTAQQKLQQGSSGLSPRSNVPIPGGSVSSSMSKAAPPSKQHPAATTRKKSEGSKAAYADYLDSPNTLRKMKAAEASAKNSYFQNDSVFSSTVAVSGSSGGGSGKSSRNTPPRTSSKNSGSGKSRPDSIDSRSATTGSISTGTRTQSSSTNRSTSLGSYQEDEDEQMRLALELSKQEALLSQGGGSSSSGFDTDFLRQPERHHKSTHSPSSRPPSSPKSQQSHMPSRTEQMRADYSIRKEEDGSLQDLLLALKLSEESAAPSRKLETSNFGGSTTMEELLAIESSMKEQKGKESKLMTDFVAAGISTDPKAQSDDQYLILEQIRLEKERAELEMALLASGDGEMGDSEEFLRNQLKLMEQFQPSKHQSPKQPRQTISADRPKLGGDGAPSPLPSFRRRRLSMASQDSNERRRELVQHGTLETQHAITAGHAHTVTCRGCQSRLQAPVSYSLVFCPKCQTISPVS